MGCFRFTRNSWYPLTFRISVSPRTHNVRNKVAGMSATAARQIVLAARPQGKPKLSDFCLEQTTVPAPNAGHVLLEVQYLSLDPYMRGRMDERESYQAPTPLGDVMPGESVARVVASHHPGYSVGDI